MSSETKLKAVASGVLFEEMGTPVDCYVLEDGRRVLSSRGELRALRPGGRDRGDLGQYLARLPNRFASLTRGHEIEFSAPQPHGGHVLCVGRDAAHLVDVCAAYAEAFAEGELHPSQIPMGRRAITLVNVFAKIGIEALVDEATGYQKTRGERDLARRFDRYLRLEPGKWEMRFTPELVRALAPLYGVRYTRGSYPRALQTPFHLIYEMVFGVEVATEMRKRNPNPETFCHHQVLKDPGQAMLSDELAVVTLLASQARTKEDFWARMRHKYLGEPLQYAFDTDTRRSKAS